jgi:hypothetical protein
MSKGIIPHLAGHQPMPTHPMSHIPTDSTKTPGHYLAVPRIPHTVHDENSHAKTSPRGFCAVDGARVPVSSDQTNRNEVPVPVPVEVVVDYLRVRPIDRAEGDSHETCATFPVANRFCCVSGD